MNSSRTFHIVQVTTYVWAADAMHFVSPLPLPHYMTAPQLRMSALAYRLSLPNTTHALSVTSRSRFELKEIIVRDISAIGSHSETENDTADNAETDDTNESHDTHDTHDTNDNIDNNKNDENEDTEDNYGNNDYSLTTT